MQFLAKVFLITLFIIFVSSLFSKDSLKIFSGDSLKKTVEKSLLGAKGQYSVFIKNLKTGETYFLNEHTKYESASLYKLWVMGEVFDQIQKGKLKEDEVLSADIVDLNNRFDIASQSAELTEGSISLSVFSALNQMITISHNYAALLLTKRIKLSNVDLFLKDNGFSESSVGVDEGLPMTTASDIGLFFEKLYKKELANTKYTNRMLDLLERQELDSKLSKYLPKETLIIHKTGELDSFSHDAGIVYLTKGDYIFVVLSKSDSPIAAGERIAILSKDVYNYFQNIYSP